LNIAKILENIDIPYMVTGGMAVLVWGRPRFTADIDIVFKLKQEQIGVLSKALMGLGEAGYVSKEAMQEAISRHDEFNFIDGESGVKVDFWVLGKNPFAISQMKRRVAKKILNEKIYFISPEDLILSKLQWYQKSQSNRHTEDVESILKISGEELDMDYLKQWAEKLGVLEILDGLIRKTRRHSGPEVDKIFKSAKSK